MTTALHLDNHIWTESEFLAIGETPERIELFDGSLEVTPPPAGGHQHVVGCLQAGLYAPARRVGLYAFPGLGVRLQPGHVRIPDFLITTEIDFRASVYDADVVRLICEIISPSSPIIDKVLKMRFYAEAGIPWYLLIDPRTEVFRLYRLDGDKYLEHASASPGELLEITEPVTATIDPAELLPRR